MTAAQLFIYVFAIVSAVVVVMAMFRDDKEDDRG